MTRQAQCSNSIYGVLSWSIRKREGEDRGLIWDPECLCVWPCDMRLLDLHTVIHAFINIVLSGTTCDHAILISTTAKQTRPALMR